jgi:hypothetical protein
MIKLIKRASDGKYLKSAEGDIWVDDVREAFEMTYRECEAAKEALAGSYSEGQLKEIADLSKSKPISREEAKELRSLLKNNRQS